MSWKQVAAPWTPALPDGQRDIVLMSPDRCQLLAAPQAVDVDLLPTQVTNTRWTALTWADPERHGKPDEVVNLSVIEVLEQVGDQHRPFVGQQTATARASYDGMADGLPTSGDHPDREAVRGHLQSESLTLDTELFDAGYTTAELGLPPP